MVEYKIKNLFDLSNNILNKDDLPIYNNFLERITCIEDNNKINYVDCDNENYNKLYAFSELYLVYTLEVEKIIELINVHKIYKLCDLSAKRYLLKDGELETYQHLGLVHYLNEESFSDKYYELLKILGLTEGLQNKLSVREALYNYNDKNKLLVKDLNSILVLFKFFKVVDPILLNYDEMEVNWELLILKSIDLTQPYWETIYYFKKYDLKNKIIKAVHKFTKTEDDVFSIELADSVKKQEEEKKHTKKDNEEYKMIKKEDSCKNKKELEILNELSLRKIIENFSGKMTNIIDDFIDLYNNKCDGYNYFEKYIYYFDKTIKILSKDERLFYVGILVFIIGILMNFVDLSS